MQGYNQNFNQPSYNQNYNQTGYNQGNINQNYNQANYNQNYNQVGNQNYTSTEQDNYRNQAYYNNGNFTGVNYAQNNYTTGNYNQPVTSNNTNTYGTYNQAPSYNNTPTTLPSFDPFASPAPTYTQAASNAYQPPPTLNNYNNTTNKISPQQTLQPNTQNIPSPVVQNKLTPIQEYNMIVSNMDEKIEELQQFGEAMTDETLQIVLHCKEIAPIPDKMQLIEKAKEANKVNKDIQLLMSKNKVDGVLYKSFTDVQNTVVSIIKTAQQLNNLQQQLSQNIQNFLTLCLQPGHLGHEQVPSTEYSMSPEISKQITVSDRNTQAKQETEQAFSQLAQNLKRKEEELQIKENKIREEQRLNEEKQRKEQAEKLLEIKHREDDLLQRLKLEQEELKRVEQQANKVKEQEELLQKYKEQVDLLKQ